MYPGVLAMSQNASETSSSSDNVLTVDTSIKKTIIEEPIMTTEAISNQNYNTSTVEENQNAIGISQEEKALRDRLIE
jgi:hypothetical protein